MKFLDIEKTRCSYNYLAFVVVVVVVFNVVVQLDTKIDYAIKKSKM